MRGNNSLLPLQRRRRRTEAALVVFLVQAGRSSCLDALGEGASIGVTDCTSWRLVDSALVISLLKRGS